MRMHAVRFGSVVPEGDTDGFPDFSPQHGSENSQVLPLRSAGLEFGEGSVGVLAINRFSVNLADTVRTGLHESRPVAGEFHAHHFVDAVGSIVPLDFVGSHVVGANVCTMSGLVWLRSNRCRTGHGGP